MESFPVSLYRFRLQQLPKADRICEKNGSWYYYDKNGKKATGWYKSAAGNQYYFGKTGAAKAGILTISGKKYCFNEKGKMLTTWQTVNGKTYFFDEKKGICIPDGLLQLQGINTISGMTG